MTDELYTFESALAMLRALTPWEESTYERNALDVYEHGLSCAGPREFETLAEAEDWWRAEYDRDLSEQAESLVGQPWLSYPFHPDSYLYHPPRLAEVRELRADNDQTDVRRTG